ncbi:MULTISPECIES: hypothetical protein [unclassified Bradyrhizobium]|uniref:hypothetical protein n=1 Tax=unclassified Bradyrhizobium TaxID=2631580 RepID=UPI002915DEE3|nr:MULTISPECIES: hypothetical protein [unclassified Bradyrhizobium]
MQKEQRRKRKQTPTYKQALLASVKSVTASYYVQKNGDGVSDEAITEVRCDIVAMHPEIPKHLGKEVTCSLMCSRKYDLVDDPDEVPWPRIGKGQTVSEMPFLLDMRLSKEGGLFSAYLREAAYWALQVDLKSGRSKFIKATFIKTRRGGGDLISLSFSETPPEQS